MAKKFKTNKSALKRVKITGTGKILKRRPHQNHFNAKESGNSVRFKKGDKSISVDSEKQIRAAISGNF